MSPVDARVKALMALARAKAAGPDLRKASPVASETAVLEQLTAWLASAAAIHATELPGALIDALTGLGADRASAVAAGELVLSRPLSGRTRGGAPQPTARMSAARRVAVEEPRLRAQHVLAAARRLTKARSDGRYDAGIEAEQRYLAQHVAAGRNRRKAAQKVDEAAKNGGPVLVWRTAGDDRVEAICRAMEGRLFTADNPPNGLYPGAAHPRCRCHAEPYGHGPLLN